MQDEPTVGSPQLRDEVDVARAVLGVLLTRYPGLVAVSELERALAEPGSAAINRASIQRPDWQTPARCGLMHRIDTFVFASYAARRAEGLVR